MKKGWIILFVVLGVFIFMGIVFIFAFQAAFRDSPVVRKNTVLKLDLAGLVTEQFSQDAFGREFEGASLQMHDIRRAVTLASADKRIAGIYLRVSLPGLGWAKAQDIRDVVNDFKKSGKFVTAFMETCNEKSYYIALAADEIYLQPHSYAEFNGFASEVPFLKRMFNKVGIEPQVDNIGKYKSSGDVLKRDSMTRAHREATEALLNDFYEEFVESVCERRSIDRPVLEAALNRGVYQSAEVLELALVDDLKYEAEVLNLIKTKVYGEKATNGREPSLRTISAGRYAKTPSKDVGLKSGSRIALVYALGTIMPGHSGYSPFSDRNMGSQSVIGMLRSAGDNGTIKAIVLRVDSPGGSGMASDEIWAAIEKVRKKKPVVVSMSDVAASGGYWIAMGSDAIVAQPLTITGSIGVVSSFFDLSGTYEKLGIVWETVKKGRRSDVPTDKRPMTRDEWEIFRKLNRDFYQVFVQKAAEGRDQTWSEIDEVAQGRVWTGERALRFGLIDSLGGLDVALGIAKQKAGIEPDAPTHWMVYPQPKGFFDSLFEKLSVHAAKLFSNGFVDLAVIQNLPAETRVALRQVATMQRFRTGEVLAIVPFVPVIN